MGAEGDQLEDGMAPSPHHAQLAVRPPTKQAALRRSISRALGAAEAEAPTEDEPAAVERPKRRVLLAEDNAVNQRVAVRLLENVGVEPDVASDGEQAVAMVRAAAEMGAPYEIVFMDIQMPHLDGYQATAQIHKEVSPSPHIIAMTANAMEGDREACLAAGLDDYVPKPVRPEAIQAALDRAEVALNSTPEKPAMLVRKQKEEAPSTDPELRSA